MEETKFENGIVEEVEAIDEVTENSGKGGLGAVAIGLGVAAVAGVAVLLYKSRDKIEARKIAKLEKKGYIITKPDEATVVEYDSDEESN